MRRLLIVAVLIAAACSESLDAPEVQDSGVNTSTTETPALREDVLDALKAYLALPADETLAVIANGVDSPVDFRWIPYLVDLLRFSGDVRLIPPLTMITGIEVDAEDVVAAYVAFGSFMLSNAIDPGPDYSDWKSDLYASVDPAFRQLLDQIDDPQTLASIQWGGVPVGGVPELNLPERIPAAEATYLADADLVFGTTHRQESVAYPLRILDVHELANDQLAGDAVALANCTLCRSGSIFLSSVDGEDLMFLTSGLLLNSNKVMLDTKTGSLWQHLTGEAIAGPLAGKQLERLPLVVTTWSEWRELNPDTWVLALPDRGADRGIEGAPTYDAGTAYGDYFAAGELWFPAVEALPVFPAKAEVATLEFEGLALAVELNALSASGPTSVEVGDELISVIPSGGGARFYLGTPDDFDGFEAGEESLTDGSVSYPRLISGQSFWFAWYGTHSDTAWWPDDG
jgi:hypothetical protein